MDEQFDVEIVGEGINGLECAKRLVEEGLKVRIVSKREKTQPVSYKACAFFDPYLAEPETLTAPWAQTTFETLATQYAQDGDVYGVEPRDITIVYEEYPEQPQWSKSIPDFTRLNRAEMEERYEGTIPERYMHGFGFRTWMIEMPKYMAHLKDYLQKSGVVFQEEHISDIADVLKRTDIVINCAGLGSQTIKGIEDTSMVPIAGQVVKIERNPEREQSILFDPDPEHPIYIVPLCNSTALGGTAIRGLDTEDPQPELSAKIMERCQEFLPEVATSIVLGEMIGARPYREEGVRVEHQPLSGGKHLLHNYGHAGGGVSLKDGCADEILGFVREIRSAQLIGDSAEK